MRTFKWMAIVMLAACGGGKKPAAKPEPMAEEKPAMGEPEKTEAAAPVAAPKKEEPPPMTMAQKIDKTTKAFLQGWNAHDVDMVLAQYDADATFKLPGLVELKGRDAIKAPVQGEMTAFPDFKVGVPRVITKDNVAVLEWVVTGTNTGDAPDQKATKLPMGVHGVDVLTFSDAGLIKEDRRYFDAGTEMAQMNPKAKKGTFRPVAEPFTGETAMFAPKGGDDEQKNLDAVNAMYKAIDDHKVDAVVASMDKDVVGEDYSQPATMKGMKAAKAFIGGVFKAIPDVKQERTAQIAAGDLVVTEGVMQGTWKGNMGPLKATKKPVALHFVDIMQLKDGKVVNVTSYANSAELMPPPAAKADKKADGKKDDAKKDDAKKDEAKKPAK